MHRDFKRTMRAILVVACGFAGCKPAGSSKVDAAVREEPRETLPPLDVGRKEADESLAKLRPNAQLPGVGALLVGGARSCLAVRIGESALLTAASCVIEPKTGYPRPGFIFDVKLGIGMGGAADEQLRSDFVVRAVHAHPSFLKYFSENEKNADPKIWSDQESLAGVVDLAVLKVQWIGREPSKLPIVSIAREWPKSELKELWLLQGSCAAPSESSKETQEPPFIEGGRALELLQPTGEYRSYVTDAYPNSRAIFDCEGFRGAPVILPEGKELLGMSSWAHPGGTIRGWTPIWGDATKEGSIRWWIESKVKDSTAAQWPSLDSELTCSREVETSIATFSVKLEPWKIFLKDSEIGLSEPIQNMSLEVRSPNQRAALEGMVPLVEAGAPPVRASFEMVRDIRQPTFVQFLTRDAIEIGEESLGLTFVSTDRKSALAVVTLSNRKTGKERTVNVYFGDVLSGEFCKKSTKASEPGSTAPRSEDK